MQQNACMIGVDLPVTTDGTKEPKFQGARSVRATRKPLEINLEMAGFVERIHAEPSDGAEVSAQGVNCRLRHWSGVLPTNAAAVSASPPARFAMACQDNAFGKIASGLTG